MEFPAELVRGEIVKCYKNLILDVQIGDEVVPVFCPELDARQKIYVPGAEVWLLPTGNPRRRLKYETQMINRDGSLIMINPTYAEVLLEEAFSAGLLTDFPLITACAGLMRATMSAMRSWNFPTRGKKSAMFMR